MQRFLVLVALVALFSSALVHAIPPPPSYETRWFTQKLDHFNWNTRNPDGSPKTYQERYLYNDQFWGKNKKLSSSNCTGPILFYTGNESPVTDYWTGSGFVTQVLAPRLGALLIFAEHRYFGLSVPFNNTPEGPWSSDHVAYCTSEQALADYANLITYLKASLPNAGDCPVFAVGGSYGGMLTTWFRISYPNMVMGGLAASAPFGFLGTGVSPNAFTDACSFTYEDALEGCGTDIQNGISELSDLASTSEGRAQIAEYFQLCNPSLPSSNDAWNVINWAIAGLEDQAMLDYPYPTNYGIPIGGWPVNQTCKTMASMKGSRAAALAKGVGSFYNGTGQKKCYDINKDVPDWGACCAWNYLYCTEVYQPSGSSGIFPHIAWNLQADIDSCKAQFNITLDPNWPYIRWGGIASIKQSSHLIFSNGLLDPWHTSGVMQSLSDTLIAIMIPESAHHLDLRGPNKQDPVYVKAARLQEETIITSWIAEYFESLKK